jgi:DNA-directed RNA polymerase specialized sigma24 family protein
MDAGSRRALQDALARLADGDRSAFHPAFALAWPVARDFARAALRQAADAEDAAQQGLLKLFARAVDYDARRDPLPWMLTFVANECRTLRRRKERRREDPLAAADGRPSAEVTPEEDLIERDLVSAAREVIASLPPGDGQTILAALSEDDRPGGATFRKRLQRARQRLREAWSARHGG